MTQVEQPKLVGSSQFGDEYTHPAYGQISASRVQGGHNYLYGSEFAHNNTIRLTVMGSSMVRDGGQERNHTRREFIEVEMSEPQWASMVSSLNMGSGTLCTIRHINGQQMPRLPAPEDKQALFAKQMSETLGEASRHANELRAMLEKSGMPKKKIEELVRKLEQVEMNIGTNVDYVGKVFGEHMEKTVTRAKTEVEAYVTGTIQRAGLAALQGSNQLITLGKPKS